MMRFQGKLLWTSLFLGLLMVTSAASAASAQTCSTADCHADYSGLGNPHAPVADGECASCHQQVQEQHPSDQGQSFQLIAEGSELCYQCHDSYGRQLFVHSPIEEGGCTVCHNPHGGDTGRALLGADHDLLPVCTQCHDAEAFAGEFGHGPAVAGACTECHDPHATNHGGLLKGSQQENCARCHTQVAEGMASAPYVHSAVKESDCTACHSPHSSKAASLLQTDLETLCMECHNRIGRQAGKAKIKHAAMYRDEKCGACHTTHFSQYPSLLFASEQDVCLSCHGQDDFRKSDPLKNIAKEIDGKVQLHGPLQDGECSACHDPHGADYFRLLKGNYPESFYHPYERGSYDFCLQCHDKNLLRFEDTSIYTEFRNGKQNLHFTHVSNKYKGRTCRACHEAHASDVESLMSEEGAEFGDWQVPTRFTKTETGGSCSPGCHRTYAYDRENPVDYEEE